MKKRMALSSLFIVTVVSLGSLWAQDAAEIIRRADQSLSSGRYYSVATITITRGGEVQPVQKIESFSMEEDGVIHTLSVYQEPRRLRGMANLTIGDDLWVRFASTGRTRKLSSSAKSNSAGGSDFSYADLGEGSRGLAEDYIPSLMGEESFNGSNHYRIALEPKDDSVVYAKMEVLIDAELYRYSTVAFFEDGAKIKTMTISDYRESGGVVFPHRISVQSHTRDSETVMITEVFEQNSPKIKDNMFSTSYLRNLR